MLGTIVFTIPVILLEYFTFDPQVKNNKIIDTASMIYFLWILVGMNMLISKTVKEKKRVDGRSIVIISVVFVTAVGIILPLLLMGRVWNVSQPYTDIFSFVCTSLISLIVPALVLRLPFQRQYAGRIWKCPHCGTLLEKPQNENWKYLGGSNVVGSATCANCGVGTPIAQVYSGRFDV